MEHNTAQRIKLALPLVDYVRSHAADLKPGTRIEETSRGLRINCQNPAHDDRNPSMDVSELENRFHCWSCGFSATWTFLRRCVTSPVKPVSSCRAATMILLTLACVL